MKSRARVLLTIDILTLFDWLPFLPFLPFILAGFIPEEGFGGYKYPHQQYVDGYHNFIDLTIYHPKFAGYMILILQKETVAYVVSLQIAYCSWGVTPPS